MTTPAQLLTEHFDIWAAAVAAKSAAGRGSNRNVELYGLKKLRELILELAVRGLLAPQDPRDEPAAVLLKQIAAEKARLTKEEKIAIQKKLPPISEDEKPFKLPTGWIWTRLGDFIYLEMGQSPSSKYYNSEGEGIPFFQGKADFGDIYPEPRYWCICPQKFAYPNDVLLSVRAPVGPTNISNIECCIGRGLAALRPLAKTPTLFLLYLMRAFQNSLESFATGTTFAAVTKTHVENLLIPIPPLQEQRRIVAKVDELMALCDRLEQQQDANIAAHQTLVRVLLAALTGAAGRGAFEAAWTRIADHFDALFTTAESIAELKQTILQLAVMGKLVPQDPADEPASVLLKQIAAEKAKLVKAGKIKKQEPLPPIREDEQPFQLPDGWAWCRIDEISLRVVDCLHSTPKFKETGRLCIDTNCIRPGIVIHEKIRFVDEETFQERNRRMKPRKDDVLFSREGALLGIAVKVQDGLDFCIGQRMMIFRLNDCVKSDYFERILNSQIIRSQYIHKITGAASPHLNIRDIVKLYVPLPPTEEQRRIVAKVDELMALCDRLHTRLAASQTTQRQLADAIAARNFLR